ncbi:MAG TPA: peptidylprolyl isomerase [Luteitalea sp.]|nr:peptidylprolyl isomerase [Luteitalea sp.]
MSTQAHRDVVTRGLTDAAADVRALALRTAGRTGRGEFLAPAVAALRDPSIDVRREAAFAVAYIGSLDPNAFGPSLTALRDALTREADGLVLSSLAENLGRLPYADAAAIDQTVQAVRAALARVPAGGRLLELGAARAAEALARRAARTKSAVPSLQQWLETLAGTGIPAPPGARPSPVAVRVRRLASTGLLTLGTSDAATGTRLTDPDAQVRRLAVIAHARTTASLERVRPALDDASVLVRQALVARFGALDPALATAALGDAHMHVRLAAIDALGQLGACRDACTARLGRAGAFGEAWHEAAHALVAFARSSPDEARSAVERASTAETWQVRMYAARAAGLTKQADVLATLATDANVNVRNAALVAWRDAKLRGLTEAAIASLTSNDGQLLITAATLLQGATVTADDVKALRDAYARLTAARRDTSRDPRLALLERINELDPQRGAVLREALRDFDPVIAERAAAWLTATPDAAGTPSEAAPSTDLQRARVRVPTWPQVRQLEATTITITLRGGRAMTLRLFPQLAPVAVARLVDQVRAGEWNGRTFHRVEPGFVLQGGSPSANEYAGADAYARDEFSALSHVRGTIGISTRGPDTGDGQVFVNLIDNARLDFAYTIIGAVAGDPAMLDDLLEGEVIVSASVTPAP